jgi:hypothetical protein
LQVSLPTYSLSFTDDLSVPGEYSTGDAPEWLAVAMHHIPTTAAPHRTTTLQSLMIFTIEPSFQLEAEKDPLWRGGGIRERGAQQAACLSCLIDGSQILAVCYFAFRPILTEQTLSGPIFCYLPG